MLLLDCCRSLRPMAATTPLGTEGLLRAVPLSLPVLLLLVVVEAGSPAGAALGLAVAAQKKGCRAASRHNNMHLRLFGSPARCSGVSTTSTAAATPHLVPGVALAVGFHMVVQPHRLCHIVQGLGPVLLGRAEGLVRGPRAVPGANAAFCVHQSHTDGDDIKRALPRPT
jgi:hypothetical protein